MNKWALLSLLGVLIMVIAFGGGIYLESIGVIDISLPTLTIAAVGGIMLTIALNRWVSKTGVEKKYLKMLRSRYRSKKTSKIEKFKIKFFMKSATTLLFPFVLIMIGVSIGLGSIGMLLGAAYGGLPWWLAIFWFLVVIPFFVWMIHWIKRTRKRWKKLRL
ncbi:MAG: hypothetical protein QMD00_03930 [Hadesarchaea archaeon]|nr:hypothetical protein [Hadesarchaea archaeon]